MTNKTPLLGIQSAQQIPYLLFRVKGSVYGVHVGCVNEIAPLPELKSIAEGTRHFVGVVNLRGDIVPVMDLELRLNRDRCRKTVDDFLLVLELDDQRFALIVNDVLGVQRLEQKGRQAEEAKDLGVDATAIEGIATVDDQIVMLLSIDGLVNANSPQAGTLTPLAPTEKLSNDWAESTAVSPVDSDVANEATASEDLIVFRRRAEQLRQQSVGQESEEWTSLAVAEICGEFYGFELGFVREFFEVQEITPVPCCPQYVTGNINLRGDVVTVIDIRSRLNLSVEGRVASGKIIVAQTEELTVGIVVDQLHGVIYMPVVDVTGTAHGMTADGESPIKGTTKFNASMMSILDLPRLLVLEDWVVDEAIGLS